MISSTLYRFLGIFCSPSSPGLSLIPPGSVLGAQVNFSHGPNHVIRGFKELWLEFQKA